MSKIDDISKLLASDNITEADHIWEISFTAKLPLEDVTEEEQKCPDCGEAPDPDDLGTIEDSLTVLGTSDALPSILKAKAYVLDPENDYVLTDFELTGVKLLASAELL